MKQNHPMFQNQFAVQWCWRSVLPWNHAELKTKLISPLLYPAKLCSIQSSQPKKYFLTLDSCLSHFFFFFLPRKIQHLLIDSSSFLLVSLSAVMLIQTCFFSLAKSFMREASQRLAVICFVCEILHLLVDLSCNSPSRFHFANLGAEDTFSHFQVSPVWKFVR